MYHRPHCQASPADNMYLEPAQFRGRYVESAMSASGQLIQRYPTYTPPSAGHSMPMSSQSPVAMSYSPGASLVSDGTVGDFPAEMPKSPSLASSKTASPPPPPPSAARKPRRRGPRTQCTAEEKEQRRKSAHSRIEKRRRERTNNVLRDLQHMVPWLSKSNKVQKLEILEAAAQYIARLRGDPTPPASDDTAEDHAECSPMKVDFLLL
ncbi:hypothetical protein IWW55_002370 [Coemansia sp. RSA 2706]|nr:hypothetical protein LPJ63_001469 [Coemansia sp. RSA 2711]KAJ2304559.1 hypothetical protein IWW55_002370 [Coemansia sp. RSA 2706]KAJ2305553.1 hypothetical protein IWW52_006395 [Coemansia sp. RSA 2704]KAJ2364399.1 hypothetical protein H4S01_003798 [Coemansia sp. RSA 2610]KAJ2386595.1 hypothetical protein H4S02_003784 [Coemansia sp. RSA 2611]